MTVNLIEGIQRECNRVRELLKEYDAIPTGAFGALVLRDAISKSEAAIAGGDVVEMLRAFKMLESCE